MSCTRLKKMRPPILLAALLWLQDSLAQEDVCSSLDGSPDRQGEGPPLSVNVSSRGKPTSLFLSWVAAEPGGFD